MKITVYELLGLMKEGKQPEHIKFDTDDWYWGYDSYIPKGFLNTTPDVQLGVSLFEKYKIDYCLKDEVEVISEPKKIHPIEYYDNSISWCLNGREITVNEKNIIDKINEIIDKINELGE